MEEVLVPVAKILAAVWMGRDNGPGTSCRSVVPLPRLKSSTLELLATVLKKKING